MLKFLSRTLLRNMVYAASCLVLFLSLLFLKVSYNSRQDFARAEAAHAEGAYKVALTHYERAIKWYTPWSPVIPHAIERIWHMGLQAEARHEHGLALEAYQTLRSSLYATQSFYLPYQSWIPKSEERIAPLLAQAKTAQGREAPQSLQEDTMRFTTQLQRHIGPHRGWSALVGIGFLGWAGATIGLIWHVIDDDGKFRWRQGALWGSVMAACFVLWTIAMRWA